MQEYRRTCKRCGKVWHSLMEREQKLVKAGKQGVCTACGDGLVSGSDSVGASAKLAVHKRQIERQQHQSTLESLHQCPNCGSASYDEAVVE